MPMSKMPKYSSGGKGRVVEHTLHGLITIRLIDPPPYAVQELQGLLGPSEGRPSDQPDIRITFVEKLGQANQRRYIGLNESAYDEDGFYLLDHRSRRATFDFERLGEPCDLTSELGESVFPYLLPVIGLRLLHKGYVMLHASSLVHDGRGILVTGWQKGGKTEMLLSFMAAGAQYLADEWTILSPSEGKMWGIPGTLQIWGWHLRYLPEYWRRLRPAERYRLRLLRLYKRIYRLLLSRNRGRGLVSWWLHRVSLDGGLAPVELVRSTPARLFGDRCWHGAAPIDLVFLAGVGSAVGVSPIEPSAIARRMVASLAYERDALLTRYQQFRFAFPDRRSELLESASQWEQEYLTRALQGRPAYEILHPYPVPLHALYQACAPILRDLRPTRRHRAVPEAEELGE